MQNPPKMKFWYLENSSKLHFCGPDILKYQNVQILPIFNWWVEHHFIKHWKNSKIIFRTLNELERVHLCICNRTPTPHLWTIEHRCSNIVWCISKICPNSTFNQFWIPILSFCSISDYKNWEVYFFFFSEAA